MCDLEDWMVIFIPGSKISWKFAPSRLGVVALQVYRVAKSHYYMVILMFMLQVYPNSHSDVGSWQGKIY